jgi:hypothetical protein
MLVYITAAMATIMMEAYCGNPITAKKLKKNK